MRHVNIVKLFGGLSSSTSKIFGIAVNAAKGVCHPHHDCSPPVVHQDVKSADIRLESQFKAKIANFGLAQMLVNAGDDESASGIASPFICMAPECGWSRKVNEKMDVLGVLLLMILRKNHVCRRWKRSLNWASFAQGRSLRACLPRMKEVLLVLLQNACTQIRDVKKQAVDFHQMSTERVQIASNRDS
ncbi:uncharacterized protein A4U43_C06F12070 [Asparagus officinalis]|uniref:non-specific serine/threonine protein kinase n=1 Tax=Asparagus officinalis TaxID=4686 RepID=A0A5P1ELB3_ASPOF|nr:uncharacterized protein A4U43_C06F12070 [Asparagus officinalis]